jgi:hypothetical protein
MKVLVAGWFSFEKMNVTAGDVIARDLACDWLTRAGVAYDLALAAPFSGGVGFFDVNPHDYAALVFVCGPFRKTEFIEGLLERFRGVRVIGLNLSMLTPEWNPFEVLLERDSALTARPDITFAAPVCAVPIVGVIRVHPQHEYKKRAKHGDAHAAIQRLIDTNRMAVINIDTGLDRNTTGLRDPREIETVISRMDVVLTTRLHGTVLALKHGVPVVAIDPIAGGAKITAQARVVGWPVSFTADALDERRLQQAFEYCLTQDARMVARDCAQRAVQVVDGVRDAFIRAVTSICTSEKS